MSATWQTKATLDGLDTTAQSLTRISLLDSV